MKNSMRVIIKKNFPSPQGKASAGIEMVVPKNQFWFKRIDAGDCEPMAKVKKAEPVKVKAPIDKSKKGSK